jgi:exopolyphosphatase/guanosine-5'-triphosphate,3'-diphosphate pyrophosphatase
MNLAVIDIGTNSILLLVAHCNTAGTLTPLAYEQRVPRLGKGVDSKRKLQKESMQQAVSVLQEYKKILKRFDLTSVVVCGTSAVRDAHNKEEFAELVQSRTGFDLEILSGEDEAMWAYRGALSGIPDIQRACVIDIGGGSTEITIGTSRSVTGTRSLDIGSVRLTERYFAHDPPTPYELTGASELIQEQLGTLRGHYFGAPTVVGVAGTATSLAILDQGLKTFRLAAVTNYEMTADAVQRLLGQLLEMTSARIAQLSAVMEGRSDVITAGTLILSQVLSYFGFSRIIVSERGVRYGLALRECEKHKEMQGPP